jgi:hypothetical protein
VILVAAGFGCTRTVVVEAGEPPEAGELMGETDCRPGAADCNPCARDVEAQLADELGRGSFGRSVHDWRFDWDRVYPPATRAARYFFDAPMRAGNGVLDGLSYHIQGFVRTNHPRIKYAGSHSNASGEKGSIFFVRDEGGENTLASMHPSRVRHPSGVAVLGAYLLVGEKGRLRVFDIARWEDDRGASYRMPATDPGRRGMDPPGGGIAAAKLAGGGYLFVVTTPGGTAPETRFNRFYRLEGEIGGEPGRELLGEQRVDAPAGHEFSENLSLLTECGTGRIYGLHTGAARSLAARGYWRLSLLVEEDGRPALRTLVSYAFRQRLGSCHLKSAATAWVGPAGEIELYCHEYVDNPSPGRPGRFRFTRLAPASRQ